MTIATETPAAPTRRTAGTSASFLARRRRAVALGLLVSAQFVVMLDTSIVNVALPSIQTDLGLGATAVTWVVNAYVLAFGGLLLLSGRAADLFGRRRMFIGGSALFTARHPARRVRRPAPGCSSRAASSRAPAPPPSARPPCRCCCSPSPDRSEPAP